MKETKEEPEELKKTFDMINDKAVQEYNKPHFEPFVMTIEIDQGRTQKILVFPDSDPEELSYEFCKNHNLDFGSLKYLKQEIAELVAKLKESQVAKFAERIQEIIHEEDENNSISHNCDLKNSLVDKTIHDKPEKTLITETENRGYEKTVEENWEKSKETSKVQGAYSNYLCTTSENNFDILAEPKRKSGQENVLSQFSPLRTEYKITNMNVFDKLYQDSRLRRLRSPQVRKYSISTSIRSSSPTNTSQNQARSRSKKTSLLNQLNVKKFYDSKGEVGNLNSDFHNYNKQKELLKKDNPNITPNKSLTRSSKQTLVRSSKSIQTSGIIGVKQAALNSPINIKSPSMKGIKSPLFGYSNYDNTSSNFSPKHNTSYDLYSKLKIKQFTQIFSLLDQDEDGMITHINAAVRMVPIQILKILRPIFSRMEEGVKNYDLNEFLEDCEEIFKKSSYLEKKVLINFNKFYDKEKKSLSISNYVSKLADTSNKTRNNLIAMQSTIASDSRTNSKSILNSHTTYNLAVSKSLKYNNGSTNSSKYLTKN